ncbi:MAG: Qat anti-phage system associated protein QatB [Patescibacteria group bacterium]
MGTSTSSSGPGAGVGFDPPWLDQIGNPLIIPSVPADEPNGNNPRETAPPDQPLEVNQPVSVAPARRFANARREMGIFARTGDEGHFRKAVGHYSHLGMGGAKNVAKRMRLSARTAAGLVSFFQTVRDGTDQRINQWINALVARTSTARDVIDEIGRLVVSDGGSLDEESCRNSMNGAMSDLLRIQPNVNLLKMNDADIWTVVELFLANEASTRLQLDIGQLFESAKLDPKDVVQRVNEMGEYMRAEIAAQIRQLREGNANLDSRQMATVIQEALANTFSVYEGAI